MCRGERVSNSASLRYRQRPVSGRSCAEAGVHEGRRGRRYCRRRLARDRRRPVGPPSSMGCWWDRIPTRSGRGGGLGRLEIGRPVHSDLNLVRYEWADWLASKRLYSASVTGAPDGHRRTRMAVAIAVTGGLPESMSVIRGVPSTRTICRRARTADRIRGRSNADCASLRGGSSAVPTISVVWRGTFGPRMKASLWRRGLARMTCVEPGVVPERPFRTVRRSTVSTSDRHIAATVIPSTYPH